MEISVSKCLEMIAQGKSFVIATVVDSEGSVPRKPGAKMTVDAAGEITGSVGGGLVEHMTIKAALEVLQDQSSTYKKFSLLPGNSNSIGMICGGTVDILVEYIDAKDPMNRFVFDQIEGALKGNVPASLVTVVEKEADLLRIDRSVYIHSEENNKEKSQWFSKNDIANNFSVLNVDMNRQVILENLSAPSKIVIFGAGHIGLKLAELAEFVGCKAIVVDDRPDYVTRERYPHALELRAIEGYRNLCEEVVIDENSFVVIVTRDSSLDRSVLEQCLDTKARYIGMIGGRTKINSIFSYLKAKGYGSDRLEQIYTPVGVQIHAETASEIAVSIIGQIIKEIRAKDIRQLPERMTA